MSEKYEGIFSDEYRRTWEYLIQNQNATAQEVSMNCDVSLAYAKEQIARIATPPENRTQDSTLCTPPERVRLLKRGIELTTGDREKTYGDPWRNLTDCAQLWEAYLNAKLNEDVKLVAEDVAHMMALVKMTRSFRGNYHDDNYLDAAVYMAIAGECRKQEGSI
jgi:hypothetical protein